MRPADDLLNTWRPASSLHSEAVAGTNKGLRVLYRFAGSASLTAVWVTFEIPARGVKRAARTRATAPARPTPPAQPRGRRIRQRSRSARPKSAVRSFEPF
jgi:hypothetical protein